MKKSLHCWTLTTATWSDSGNHKEVEDGRMSQDVQTTALKLAHRGKQTKT